MTDERKPEKRPSENPRRAQLRDLSALKRAVVLSEILGKPLSRREKR